ncbi:MAG: Asp-tRNA(Asn)/Glu-tRNA(Gln) amidotransferase subunit GatA [Bacilli bacterium]
MKYLDLSIKEINELLKNKTIKPVDLVKEALDKIKNSNLNCFITLNEKALEEAMALEDKEVDNLLFGLPIAIKDNIVTKDLKTTAASKMLEDFMPIYDASVIKKIKDKHMIIIGKTNMDEFAMGSTGETSYFENTLNPWDNTLTPGGSSSGSAACVASGITPLALGTDTGGSIRQPASFCGLVGLKPTYGTVSRYGLIAFASSLDQIGPMTKNVYDNALVLNAISGYDENDLTSSKDSLNDYTTLIGQDIKNLNIAIPNYYMSDVIDNEVKTNINKIIILLEKKGCKINYIDIAYLEYAVPLYQIIALSEASSNLARYDGVKYGIDSKEDTMEAIYKDTRSNGFGNEVKRRIMIGSYILSGSNADKYYYKALKIRKKMTDSFKENLAKYDLIIGPTNTNVAYKLGVKQDDVLKSFYDDILTIPVNMAGLPGLSMPIGFNHDHLPIGMQIIGNYFKEDKIYQLAYAIEKELNLDTKPKGVK